MYLDDFIAAKPPELRLGQWFYNSYLVNKNYQRRFQEPEWLYNSHDDQRVVSYILNLMEYWQTDELPELGHTLVN
jgi:hypothetical protein